MPSTRRSPAPVDRSGGGSKADTSSGSGSASVTDCVTRPHSWVQSASEGTGGSGPLIQAEMTAIWPSIRTSTPSASFTQDAASG